MKKKNGFTLVELLAAIVILGVLMATAAGAFGAIKENNAKKELEQIAVSVKKIGETMYTSSVIKGEDLFDSNRIEKSERHLSDDDKIWTREGSIYKTKSSCPSGQKGIISYDTSINSVTFDGCVLYNDGLIESEYIENPFNKKNPACNISLKLTKSSPTASTQIEACVTCDNKGQKVITCAKKDEVVVTCKNSRGEVVPCK